MQRKPIVLIAVILISCLLGIYFYLKPYLSLSSKGDFWWQKSEYVEKIKYLEKFIAESPNDETAKRAKEILGKLSENQKELLTSKKVHDLASSYKWQTIESKNITLYHTNDAIAKQLLERTNKFLEKITSGMPKPEVFVWNPKCEIFVFDSKRTWLDFIKKSGYPSICEGFSLVDRFQNQKTGKTEITARALFTYQSPILVESVIPHELTHVVFNDLMHDRQNIPLWLYEGLGRYEETGERTAYLKKSVKARVTEGTFIPVGQLLSATDFPVNEQDYFVSESASFIGFLIKNFGRDTFIKFIDDLNRDASQEEALKIYYTKGASLDELNLAWVNYVKENY